MDRSDNTAPSILSRVLKRIVRTVLSRGQRRPSRPEGPARISFDIPGPRGREADRQQIEGMVEPGTTLLQAAARLDVDIAHFCGGCCSCGTCRVEILSGGDNLTRSHGAEQMVLGYQASSVGDRLACQARVKGPVAVRVPLGF